MGKADPTESWSSLDEFVAARRAVAQTCTLPDRASRLVDHGESVRLIGRASRAYYSNIYLWLLFDFLLAVVYWFTVGPSQIDRRVVLVMVGVSLPIAGATILLWGGWATMVLVSERRIAIIGGWSSARVVDEMPLAAVSGIVMTRRMVWPRRTDTYIVRLSKGGEKKLGWLEFRVPV
jgi:hypothetical protein